MRLCTVSEMKKIDQLAQSHHGLPSVVLMETAGQTAVQILVAQYSNYLSEIVIVVGPGNNGGDGLVAARALHDQGYQNIKILMPLALTNDNKVFELQLERVKSLGIVITNEIKILETATIVIDALFGIGLSRPIENSLFDLIKKINTLNCFRFSIDVPSGLNADTGLPQGICIKAHVTLTFGLSKVGFHIQDGPEYVGNVMVQNIGFPQTLLEQQAQSSSLFDKSTAKKIIKPESVRINKSKRGKLLVIAGNHDFWGAGLLACQMALRAGTGYVYWTSFQNPMSELPMQPEIIVKPLDEVSDFSVFGAVLVGPGLGVSEKVYSLIKRINNNKVILDADAINSLAKFGTYKLNPNWVVTPHSGELARVLKILSEEIEADRVKALENAHEELGCFVLLKGFHSQLRTANKTIVINSGNKALAKAGSGDVLAGLIGAFAAQDYNIESATLLGAYLHGATADRWVEQGKSARSLIPSDLKEELAFVLYELEKDI